MKLLDHPLVRKNPNEWIKTCSKCHTFIGSKHICKDPKPFLERLESKIKKTKYCWIWESYVAPDGYSRIWDAFKKRAVKASRASFEYFIGAIPRGLLVLHKCDNPRCVNPKHLWLGTSKDNTQDAIKKGRFNFKHLVGARWK